MPTYIHTKTSPRRNGAALSLSHGNVRTPNYDCREFRDEMRLVVYVPGVNASGVEIEAVGADLVITARKEHFVRVNWQALHLEGSQRDYQLRLRLGLSFDYAEMQASIHDGVLTVTLPKRQSGAQEEPRMRRVA